MTTQHTFKTQTAETTAAAIRQGLAETSSALHYIVTTDLDSLTAAILWTDTFMTPDEAAREFQGILESATA